MNKMFRVTVEGSREIVVSARNEEEAGKIAEQRSDLPNAEAVDIEEERR